MQYFTKRLALAIGIASVSLTISAKVVTDGTVGRAQTLSGPNYAIGAEFGTQRGANLFHSFTTFGLQSGETALFTGPVGLQNVINRVTGGEVSSIDGTLRSEITGANFYFINPAGVTFGANAKIDVPAAFHVSTADQLRFADGNLFSAGNPAVSILSAEPIAAFGFLSATPKRLAVNRSGLQVREGQTFSLIGGDINLTNADISADAGRLNIAAVGSIGEVGLTHTDVLLQGFGALGILTMGHSKLTASGMRGGAIFIRANACWLNGAALVADTIGDQNGIGIDIGLSGDLTLINNAHIDALSQGIGNAGNVTVKVAETLTLLDAGRISSSTHNLGHAGNVTILAKNLLIDGYQITGYSENGEPVQDKSGITSESYEGAVGNAGNINITVADTLSVLNGSEISTDAYSPGNAGSVTIDAMNLIVEHTDPKALYDLSSISSSSEGHATGNAGDITLTIAGNLRVNGGYISTGTYDSGNGGNLRITVGKTLDILSMGQIRARTQGTGKGGTITIEAGQGINIAGGAAVIDAGYLAGFLVGSEASTGQAGDLILSTPVLTISGFSAITGRSDHSGGGNLTINAEHLKLFDGGQISASVSGGSSTQGGDVTLNSTNIVILNGSTITAKATQGKGGNITVNADVLLHDAPTIADVLNASSEVIGNNGTVQSNVPQMDSSGILAGTNNHYDDLDTAQRDPCARRRGQKPSTLSKVGRGGLPADNRTEVTTSFAGGDWTPPPEPTIISRSENNADTCQR